MDKILMLGQMDNTKDHTFESANRIYGSEGIAPTIPTCGGGGIVPKIMQIVGMRGRDKTDPNHRGKHNENYEQVLEINSEGICNALTTVQKDNMVLERKVLDTKTRCGKALTEQNRTEQNRTEQSCLIRQATKDGLIRCDVPGIADLAYPTSKTRRGRVIDEGMTCPTLTTESIPNVLEPWTWEIDGEKYIIRIRKLTPKECWRLMDFADSDFEKAKNVNSNTQLYKQAGNSIVKNVLVAVFGQMLPGREDVYKNREPAADFMNLPVEEEE